MRVDMRPILVVCASSLVVAAASLACTRAPAPSSNDDTSDQNSTSAAPTAPAATVAPPPPAPTTDPDAMAPVVPDGSAIVVIPSGTDAGALCNPDSVHEIEPNNDATTANVIPAVSSTYCGRVDPGDTDNVTFIMPQAVGNFTIQIEQFTGGIDVSATAGGQAFSFFGEYPFLPGQPYNLMITPRGPISADYRIRFTFQ
jgi:hypothetical protein